MQPEMAESVVLMGRRLLMVLAALAVTASGFAPAVADDAPGATRPPNIILIMTDDQGYGDIGVNANPLIETPNLDRLHGESVRLTDFHVDPTCSPTRAALLTGRYSLRAKVWHTIMGRSILPTGMVTLPERLKDKGYTTAIFGKWHLGDNYPFRPQDQGFDFTAIHQGGGVGQTPDYWGNIQFDDTYNINGKPQAFRGWSTDVWFELATDFIEANREKPFFAYIATNAPHSPYRAQAADIQRYLDKGLPERTARFYAMISAIDRGVGALRKRLAQLDIDRNTILIFMTDNGSSLRPQAGLPDAEGWEFNAGMRGYKASVYEGGHRVPFYIHWPDGQLGPPRDIDVLTAHFDIMPTLLALAGDESGKGDFDGVNLAPLLRGEAQPPDRALVVVHQRVDIPDPARPHTVMAGRWRLVRSRAGGAAELFDIGADPSQQHDIAAANPTVVERLTRAYEGWWARNAPADAENNRQRIIVGAAQENPARLTAMDWMEAGSEDDIPWFSGFQGPGQENVRAAWLGREGAFAPLPWYVEAAETGQYRLSAWLHDEPAMTPVMRKFAIFEIDGEQRAVPIEPMSAWAQTDLQLAAGPHRLRMWFADDEAGTQNVLPAFYVYAELLAERPR
jgi:arylsulfatase A-like enzyme